MKLYNIIGALLIFFVFLFLGYLLRGLKHDQSLISFDQNSYDLGTLDISKIDTIYFVYKNVSNSSLTILDIQTRCGCTVPTWSTSELKNNQKDSLMVIIHPENEGFFRVPIYVISNSSSSPDELIIIGQGINNPIY